MPVTTVAFDTVANMSASARRPQAWPDPSPPPVGVQTRPRLSAVARSAAKRAVDTFGMLDKEFEDNYRVDVTDKEVGFFPGVFTD